MKNGTVEIKFYGSGGHGIVVAAKLLADAAAKAGYQAQSFASYGSARRGGKVESYVRISDKNVLLHSKIYKPDILVVMDKSLLQAALSTGTKEGETLLVNATDKPEALSSMAPKVVTLDADGIARDKGLQMPSGALIINTTMLGAVTGLFPEIGIQNLTEALMQGGIPQPKKNADAAAEAFNRVQSGGAGAAVAEKAEQKAAPVAVEKRPRHVTKRAPCEANCPAGEPVETTVALVQEGRFEEALQGIMAENPFPGICGQACFAYCATACNRNQFDEGIATQSMERAAFEHAKASKVAKPAMKQKTGKKVAVVGSGPAGMACAYFLTLLGHAATVFEAAPVIGGAPKDGIPQKRLPKDVVDKEMAQILALGVEAKTNTAVGKDFSFEDIMRKYDACFVATGPQRPGKPGAAFLPASIEMDNGFIKTDFLCRTSMKGVYAGGDVNLRVMKDRSVARAVGSGKRAAVGIDIFLKGGGDKEIAQAIGKAESGAISMENYMAGKPAIIAAPVVAFADLNTSTFDKQPKVKAVSKVAGQPSPGLSKAQAVREAERCFHCGHCNLCETCYILCPDVAISFDQKTSSYVVNYDRCPACGICIAECPRSVIVWEKVIV